MISILLCLKLKLSRITQERFLNEFNLLGKRERERDERGDLKIYFEMGEIILACFELGREERSAVWQNAIPHYKYYKYKK